MKRNLLKLLGANLRKLRLKAGLKIVQLAEDINYPASHISNIEYGKVNASLDFIDAFIERIKCHPADLFIDENHHIIDDLDYKLLEYARIKLLNHEKSPLASIPAYKTHLEAPMIHEPKAKLKKFHKKPKK